MMNRTIATICGERWGRMMPLSHAAAYTGLSLDTFIGVFGDLVVDWQGKKAVDKTRLDKEIDKMLYGGEEYTTSDHKAK